MAIMKWSKALKQTKKNAPCAPFNMSDLKKLALCSYIYDSASYTKSGEAPQV